MLFGVFQDPLETVRAKCEQSEHCAHLKERLEACEARVNSRSHTEEECTEELFDFLHARDHCVSVDKLLWGLYYCVFIKASVLGCVSLLNPSLSPMITGLYQFYLLVHSKLSKMTHLGMYLWTLSLCF